MSVNVLLLQRRLMAGSWTGLSLVLPPPPAPVSHIGITSGFTSVTVDPAATVSASFTLYRQSGDLTASCAVVWAVVPSLVDGVDASYFSDAAVLTGKTVMFLPGQTSLSVSVTFAAHAAPTKDLSGSILLLSVGTGAVVDTVAGNFTFSVPKTLVTQPRQPWEDDQTQWAIIKPLAQVPGGNKVAINTSADLAQLANAVPGTYYVIGANVSGSVTVDSIGTLAAPIVICGAYEGNDETQFPKWTSGQLTVTGAHVYVRRICFPGGQDRVYLDSNATRVSIERCWSYGQVTGNPLEIPFVRLNGGAPLRYWRVRFCTHGNASVATAGLLCRLGTTKPFPSHPKYGWVYGNRVFNISSAASLQYHSCPLYFSGNNESDTNQNTTVSIYDNLIGVCPASIGETIEIKTSENVVARNTFEAGTSGDAHSLRIRHGKRNLIAGNLFVRAPGQKNSTGNIQVRDSDNVVVNNWSVVLGDGVQPSSGSTLASDQLQVHGGQVDAISYPASEGDLDYAGARPSSGRPNACRNKIGGNRMPVILGVSNDTYVPPLGAAVNTVGPAGGPRKDRNSQVSMGPLADKDYAGRGQTRHSYSGGTAYGTAVGSGSTDYTTPISGADYDVIPTRMLPSTTGHAAPEPSTGVTNPADPGSVFIGPDVTVNYAALLGNGTGLLAQLNDGVELKGGLVTDLLSGIRLLNKTMLLTPPYKVRFKFTRKVLPSGTTNQGSFYLVGAVKAPGQPGGNPGLLPPTSPSGDDSLAGAITGFRFAFGTLTDYPGAVGTNRARCSIYLADGTRTQLPPDDGVLDVIDLGLNVPYTMELSVSGNTATLACVELGLSESYTSPLIGTYASGYLMFYSSFGTDGVFSEVTKVS